MGDDWFNLGWVADRASSMTCSGASLVLVKEFLRRLGEPGLCGCRVVEGLTGRLFGFAGPNVLKAKLSLFDSLPVEPTDELLPCLL